MRLPRRQERLEWSHRKVFHLWLWTLRVLVACRPPSLHRIDHRCCISWCLHRVACCCECLLGRHLHPSCTFRNPTFGCVPTFLRIQLHRDISWFPGRAARPCETHQSTYFLRACMRAIIHNQKHQEQLCYHLMRNIWSHDLQFLHSEIHPRNTFHPPLTAYHDLKQKSTKLNKVSTRNWKYYTMLLSIAPLSFILEKFVVVCVNTETWKTRIHVKHYDSFIIIVLKKQNLKI